LSELLLSFKQEFSLSKEDIYSLSELSLSFKQKFSLSKEDIHSFSDLSHSFKRVFSLIVKKSLIESLGMMKVLS